MWGRSEHTICADVQTKNILCLCIRTFVISVIPRLFSIRSLVVFSFLTSSFTAKAQIDAEVVTNMGRNALAVDDYITAIHYFNQAIESKPFLSSPYYYRAYAKFTLEDFHGAETDCDRSISLNPFIVEVYQLRGLCRIHNDNYVGAIDDYSRALRELPDDQGARYNRALCFLQLKRYDQADADLTYMLQKWPNYYRTYMVKAQSLLEQKDTVQAFEWIDKLLVKNPRDGNAWSFKGRYELTKNNYSLSDSCLTQAINYLPNDFELYIARAQARHALNKFGLAIADYDRTIELQPTHFVAHYNRGLLRSLVGDLNRAIDDFDYVIKVEPSNTLAIYNRALLRAKVGNLKGAIADYSRLIKSYPNFMYGYLQRASLRRKVGDVKGALNDETVVARRNLDVSMGRARAATKKKVRLRSEHELDKYQQLVQEDPDTARNVFGTFFGKVQNERVPDDFLPMYVPAFRNVYVQGYHAVGFFSEMTSYCHLNTSGRVFTLSAETEINAAQNAEYDERTVERNQQKCSCVEKALAKSAIALSKYDYISALNEVNAALHADSTSVAALFQRSNVLMHQATTVGANDAQRKAQLQLAQADLRHAASLSPTNAYVAYNLGCLLAFQQSWQAALNAFSLAIQLDARLPEAYYNRSIVHQRLNENEQARADLSKAGQLGLYKAYALLKNLK